MNKVIAVKQRILGSVLDTLCTNYLKIYNKVKKQKDVEDSSPVTFHMKKDEKEDDMDWWDAL